MRAARGQTLKASNRILETIDRRHDQLYNFWLIVVPYLNKTGLMVAWSMACVMLAGYGLVLVAVHTHGHNPSNESWYIRLSIWVSQGMERGGERHLQLCYVQSNQIKSNQKKKTIAFIHFKDKTSRDD